MKGGQPMESKLQLIVTQCAWCRCIISCTVAGSIILLKAECITCDRNGHCGVQEHYDLFDVSHGYCSDCLNYYYGGTT